MRYQQPFDQPTLLDAPYINGDPATGIQGSIPSAASFEHHQRELVNLLTYSGITPNESVLTQVTEAVQNGYICACNDIGTANAMIATLPFKPLAGYTFGMKVFVKKIAAVNTGAVTVNLNGIGVVPVVDATGAPLVNGSAPANMVMELVFDGTSFRFMNGGVTYTTVGSITALSGEGILVDGTNHVNLNYPGLTTNNFPGENDLFSYYNLTDVHHRDITLSNLRKAIGQQTGEFLKEYSVQTGTYFPITAMWLPGEGGAMPFNQGQQILTLTLTPQSSSSIFDIHFSSNIKINYQGTKVVTGAIYRNTALVAQAFDHDYSGASTLCWGTRFKDVPNTASSITYSVRVANGTAPSNLSETINGAAPGYWWASNQITALFIIEIRG